MACGCAKPETTELWTPIPGYFKQTQILPGENIDCYSARAGMGSATGEQNNSAEKTPDRVENTSLASDLNANVDETLSITPGSTRTPTAWTATVNGQPLSSVLPELSVDQTTGKITGTVSPENANKNYKVMVEASDANGAIDSREFNMFPKEATKDETVKFVNPLPGGRVTSGFGPRNSPTAGASSNHKGIDMAGATDIVAAADGTVVAAGPARGFGNWIKIEHRDAQGSLVATSVYGHMDTMNVKVGQKVAAGQVIAPVGNAGVGTGKHLHFEMHKGKWGNPVDPMPYLNGTIDVARNNKPGEMGEADESTYETKSQQNRGMTSREAYEANFDCPDEIPGQNGVEPGAGGGQIGPAVGGPEPTVIPTSTDPTKAETQAAIQRALDEDPSLTDADKKHLMFVAKIESGFDADAKNPTSSARGTYQMLDKTATSYYNKIGVEPTVANRNDPYLATKAQIEFYKREQKPYYNEFQTSGTIAGKTPPADAAARYSGLTQGEFTYGLIHHDGVGNAANGKDKQGVDYYRTQVRKNS